MAPIPPFGVEKWMDDYETKCKFNLAETCCASVSLSELIDLSEDVNIKHVGDLLDPSTIQDYGEIQGSTALRRNLSALYSAKVTTPLLPENILITPGAIAANHLVLYALLSPGDHVICHHPTYQQLYSIPTSFGANVDYWHARPENDWQLDLEELKALVKENTRLIIINNPQNPTGAVIAKPLLQSLVDFASERKINVLSDEVYRPLFHSISPIDPDFPPSLVSVAPSITADPNVIVTGSLSKAYSLAGIRVGWIASRSSTILKRLADARHYTTISVSKLDQSVAAFALSSSTIHALLARNLALARTNLELLSKFVIKFDENCSWTPPKAGTTAFIKFIHDDGRVVDSRELCKRILEKTGVLLMPGDDGFFGEEFKGYVRFGYVNRTEIVKDGLEALRGFMKRDLEDVPATQ